VNRRIGWVIHKSYAISYKALELCRVWFLGSFVINLLWIPREDCMELIAAPSSK
jgi:hypothetical protein